MADDKTLPDSFRKRIRRLNDLVSKLNWDLFLNTWSLAVGVGMEMIHPYLRTNKSGSVR